MVKNVYKQLSAIQVYLVVRENILDLGIEKRYPIMTVKERTEYNFK